MPKSLSVPEAQSHRELLLLPRTSAPPSLCPPPLAVTAQDHGLWTHPSLVLHAPSLWDRGICMLFSIRPSSTAPSLPVLPTCWACLAIPEHFRSRPLLPCTLSNTAVH